MIPKESLSDFAQALLTLARKSYPDSGVPEQLMVNLFLKGLQSSEMQKHVYFASPKTLSHATELATQFESFGMMSKATNGLKKPKNEGVAVIGETGAIQSSRVVTPVEESPVVDEGMRKQFAQFLSWMKKQGPKKPFSKANIECWNCKQKGHYKSECPAILSQSPATPLNC